MTLSSHACLCSSHASRSHVRLHACPRAASLAARRSILFQNARSVAFFGDLVGRPLGGQLLARLLGGAAAGGGGGGGGGAAATRSAASMDVQGSIARGGGHPSSAAAAATAAAAAARRHSGVFNGGAGASAAAGASVCVEGVAEGVVLTAMGDESGDEEDQEEAAEAARSGCTPRAAGAGSCGLSRAPSQHHQRQKAADASPADTLMSTFRQLQQPTSASSSRSRLQAPPPSAAAPAAATEQQYQQPAGKVVMGGGAGGGGHASAGDLLSCMLAAIERGEVGTRVAGGGAKSGSASLFQAGHNATAAYLLVCSVATCVS